MPRLYAGLYGARFAVQSLRPFAQAIGYPRAPVDDLIVFHVVFGKSVADISLNAIANLGYADCRFSAACLSSGDTLSGCFGSDRPHERTPVGRPASLHVRTTGRSRAGRPSSNSCAGSWCASAILQRRRTGAGRASARQRRVDPAVLAPHLPRLDASRYDDQPRRAAPYRWADYVVGEKIDHADAMTLEEAEHQIATRLYQNTARVHFNQHAQAQGQFKRRLVYGGIIMSLARALSFNGLANAFHIAAINGGRHVAPSFAGDTIYAWSEILETAGNPSSSRCRRPCARASLRSKTEPARISP